QQVYFACEARVDAEHEIADARVAVRRDDRNVGAELARDGRKSFARHDRYDAKSLLGDIDDEQPVLSLHVLDLLAQHRAVLCSEGDRPGWVRRVYVDPQGRRIAGHDERVSLPLEEVAHSVVTDRRLLKHELGAELIGRNDLIGRERTTTLGPTRKRRRAGRRLRKKAQN